jgi:hypothetical protein
VAPAGWLSQLLLGVPDAIQQTSLRSLSLIVVVFDLGQRRRAVVGVAPVLDLACSEASIA